MTESNTKSGFDVTKLFLPGAILFAAVLISGTVLYTKLSPGAGVAQVAPDENEKVDVSADDDAALGDVNAPVTIIEFSDYECPFCRRFWKETLPELKKQYIDTGKVRFVYRDYPLSFHPGAQPAAEAAECAGDQNKYWEMHDAIFAQQDKQGSGTIQFGVTELKQWARTAGLNAAAFNECLDSQKYKSEVQKDFADGGKVNVDGTPTFFINGKRLVGAQPFTAFQAAIEEALK